MYFKPDAKISDEEYLRTYNIFRLGDIAFEGNKSKNYAFGRFVENTIGDGIVSHVFVVFRPVQPNHNLGYWKYAINNENVMGRILARCTKKTTMMTNLVTDDFLKEEMFCPSAEEQTKISTFLELLDKKIESQTKLVEHLKKYKRGVLEQFIATFQSNNASFVSLKEITQIYDGTHQTPNYQTHGVKFVSVENIESLLDTRKYISKEDFEKEFKISPSKGDVLMTRIGDIGRSSYVDFDTPIAFYVSLALFKCKNQLDGRYLAHYIMSNAFQEQLWKRTLHIAFPKKINTCEIGECEILLPSLDDQRHCAKLLDSIDLLINKNQKILEYLTTQRLGILQQIFI